MPERKSPAPSGATVVSVARSAGHDFSKTPSTSIRLLEGLGVEDDAHAGVTVQHRSRVRRNPHAPNLRQVHLIHAELFEDLATRGYTVAPGQLGENITTRNIALLALGRGTRLALGAEAVVEITGLRNPCSQLNDFAPDLMHALLRRSDSGQLERLSGVMAVVIRSGTVTPGDTIGVISGSEGGPALEPV